MSNTPTERAAERFQDAIDAHRQADAWVEGVATADEGPHREIRRVAFAGEDGGAVLYVNAGRIKAAALVVRDDLNFSVALRMFPPLPQAERAPSREEIARAICTTFGRNPDHWATVNNGQRAWERYLPHADAVLALLTPGQSVAQEVVYLREMGVGTDNACWVVCAKADPGAVRFVEGA